MRIKVYDLKAWLPFLFDFHQENIFRRLRPLVLVMILYAGLVSSAEYFLRGYYKVIDDFTYLGQFHLLFSFVLSIMMAFRVNTAYARWWEGRGLWGQLVNNSRNLAQRFEAFVGLDRQPLFKNCLMRFPELLKYHLRRETEQAQQLMNELGIKWQADGHLPNLMLKKMNQVLNQHRLEQTISLEQYLLLSDNLAALTDVLGGCEKIRNTPTPMPFSVLIKQALFFYMLIFPFGWAGIFGFFVIPIIIVIVYVLWGLEALADELEDPFNYADNDLPLDVIVSNLAQDIALIADEN